MKRITAQAAIAILVLSGAAYGAGADISFRLSGGAVWARYSHSPEPLMGTPDIINPEIIRLNYRAGAAIGAGCDIALPFSRSLTSLSSIEYIQKGSQEQYHYFMNVWPPISRSYKLEAISLTQLIKIKPFPTLFPYALAGFELSHILSHEPGGEIIICSLDPDFGRTDDTRKSDFGLVAGVGSELAAGRWAAFLEARYHLGLVNISKGTGQLWHYPTIKTRAFTLLVGIRYKLGKKAS